MEQLYERLARLRKERKFTAKAVAEAIGEAESTYRGWENERGRKLPPFEKLSQVLSKSVSELVVGHRPEVAEALQILAEVEEQLRRLRLKIGSRI